MNQRNFSCVDLTFTDQPNLSVNSGVHASLHPNCHHQFVHSSFSLNISLSPPYQRLVWDYKRPIQKILEKPLIQLIGKGCLIKKLLTHKLQLLMKILNVFRNYVPNKYITIDDRGPVWMNENTKTEIKEKNTFHQKYIENGRFESDSILLEKLIT